MATSHRIKRMQFGGFFRAEARFLPMSWEPELCRLPDYAARIANLVTLVPYGR
jgi:hypothetical protein